MKVSVIIPVYNVEKYLKQCVDSVLNQSYQDIEVILINDGSTDACPEICDEYKKKDARIIVIHQENGGSSSARNRGISVMTGEYVMFLDADDYWDDVDAVKRLIERVLKTNPDVLNYSYKKYYEDTEKKIPQFSEVGKRPLEMDDKKGQLDFLTKDFLYIASACNKMIRAEVLSKHMKFEEGKSSEDVEWCARLLVTSKTFDFVCENFYCYRQHATSTTHTFGEKSCVDLKNNILGCIRIAENATSEIQEYIYRYTAYQLSTFVAVQALASKCPSECIEELKPYQWLFKYHGRNKRVTCLYIIDKVIGLRNMCILMRLTKKLWG